MSTDTIHPGRLLIFYSRQRARHDGMLVHEWLLELAKRQGIGGGSAFRAIAGYGRHGVLHEQQFFDLADDLPVKVEFLLDETRAEALLAAVRAANVDVVYASLAAGFEVLGKH